MISFMKYLIYFVDYFYLLRMTRQSHSLCLSSRLVDDGAHKEDDGYDGR